MKLLCGLGNPGVRYRNTWHNLGFLLLDLLASRAGAEFRSGRGSFLECRVHLGGEDLLLVKPTTYMNLSGQAVQEARQFYKLETGDLLLAFDDMDLPLGEIRFRREGSGGNHNGMNHILQVLGTRKLQRLRLGFRPPVEISSSSWKRLVLAPIPTAALDEVQHMLERAAEGLEVFYREGMTAAMNRCNRQASGKADADEDATNRRNK